VAEVIEPATGVSYHPAEKQSWRVAPPPTVIKVDGGYPWPYRAQRSRVDRPGAHAPGGCHALTD